MIRLNGTLRNLFYGNITPGDRKLDKDYRTAMLDANTAREELEATMTDEQKKLLDRYADLTGNATACLEMSNFIYGFRLGVCLLLDSITGKDEN